MATRLQHHARQAQRGPVRSDDRPRPAKAGVGADLPARRPAPPAPADYAFTHDPLTGNVTRHESGLRPSAGEAVARTGGAPVDAGIYQGAEDANGPPQPGGNASWSDLESGAVPAAEEAPGSIARSIPAPTAVH